MSLQFIGSTALGELLLLVVVPTLIVAFGSYVGVLMALQTFFDESSWQDVRAEAE